MSINFNNYHAPEEGRLYSSREGAVNSFLTTGLAPEVSLLISRIFHPDPIAEESSPQRLPSAIQNFLAPGFINERHPKFTLSDISRVCAYILEGGSEQDQLDRASQVVPRFEELWADKTLDLKTDQDIHAALYLSRQLGELIPLLKNHFFVTAAKLELLQETYATTNSVSWLPVRKVMYTAAEKGKAYQAGLKAINQLTHEAKAIKPLGTSANQVYLAEHHAIFKSAPMRASEEERQVESIMSQINPGGVLPSFAFKDLNRLRLLMEPGEHPDRHRTVQLENVSPICMEAIVNRLEGRDEGEIFAAGYKIHQHFTNDLERDLSYQQPNGKWQPVNFNEICQSCREGKIGANTLFRSKGDPFETITFSEIIESKKEFSKAIAFDNLMKRGGVRFMPDLSDNSLRMKFEKCEHYTWEVEDPKSGSKIIPFNELIVPQSMTERLEQLRFRDSDGQFKPLREFSNYIDEIAPALNAPWKMTIDPPRSFALEEMSPHFIEEVVQQLNDPNSAEFKEAAENYYKFAKSVEPKYFYTLTDNQWVSVSFTQLCQDYRDGRITNTTQFKPADIQLPIEFRTYQFAERDFSKAVAFDNMIHQGGILVAPKLSEEHLKQCEMRQWHTAVPYDGKSSYSFREFYDLVKSIDNLDQHQFLDRDGQYKPINQFIDFQKIISPAITTLMYLENENRQWQSETPINDKSLFSFKQILELSKSDVNFSQYKFLDGDGQYKKLDHFINYDEVIEPSLDINWKLMLPKVVSSLAESSTLTDIVAKPYVEMNIYKDLLFLRPGYLNFALSRLLPNSEAAYMTQEMGLYDLHSENMGIPIKSTVFDYEYSSSFDYRYTTQTNQQVTVDFDTFAHEFDQGHVTSNTAIELISNDRLVGWHMPLKDAGRLISAIEQMNRGETPEQIILLDNQIYRYTTRNGEDRSGVLAYYVMTTLQGRFSITRPSQLFLKIDGPQQ